MRRALALALLIAAGLCGGCEKPVNVLDNLIAQPQAVTDLGYSIQWQANLGLVNGDRLLYTQLLGDRLVTLETDNVMSVIDVNTGRVLWRTKLAKEVERFSKPVRDRNKLIICSETRCFIFDIVDGNRLKVFDLSYVSATTPVLSGGLMVHGSTNGMIFAQDMTQGLLTWHLQTGASITALPPLVGATLFVGNSKGMLNAMNPRSGAILWTKHAFDRISAPPAVTENLIYVPSSDQSLYAFQRTTGKLRWRYFAQTALVKSPVPMGDLVLQQIPDSGLVAINAFSGVKAWSRPDLARAVPLFALETKLYFWNNDSIIIVASKDGQTLKGVAAPQSQYAFADDAKARNIYLVRLDGAIMKISPK